MFLLLQSYTLTQTICSGWTSAVQTLKRERLTQKRLMGVFTPLKVAEWEHMLAQHPDRQYVAYLLRGIQEGFRIRYERGGHLLGSARKNMRAAWENPQVILEVEQKRRVLLGPFERSEVRFGKGK